MGCSSQSLYQDQTSSRSQYQGSFQSQQQSTYRPNQSQGQGNQGGRIFNLTLITNQKDHTVMESSLVLFSTGVKVLFDTGASHFFISTACAISLGLKLKHLEYPISVGIPTGNSVHLSHYCTIIISHTI